MEIQRNNTVKNRDNFFLLFCDVWYAYHSCHGSIILPVCSLETPVQREGPYSLYNSPPRVYDSHIRRSFRTMLMFDHLQCSRFTFWAF